MKQITIVKTSTGYIVYHAGQIVLGPFVSYMTARRLAEQFLREKQ